MRKENDKGWFIIRDPLTQSRQRTLTFFSFLMPILIWCFFSYTPFVWHPDIRLEVSATRTDVATVFTSGDHLSREYFPGFVVAIERDNKNILKQQRGEEALPPSLRTIRRANTKNLRHIIPLALKEGWLDSEATGDDLLMNLWEAIATSNNATQEYARLSETNHRIIRENWAIMDAQFKEKGDRKVPSVPLQKLVPQGVRANPVYLPAPHEVLLKGWEEFTKEPKNDKPSMFERLRHSMRIVFGGFLLSCIIGIPLGVLCGTYDFFSKLFEPFIDFFRYLPAPSFSTLLVAVFLAHDAPKIALVFLGTFFQLVLIVSKTTQLLDKSLLEAALTLGAGKKTLITRVILPGIMPNLYNDLRILLGWAWTWLVIAELIGVKSGLTEFIETQGRWRNFDSVFPIIFTIGFIGFCTDQILAQLRGFLFPWTGEKVNIIIRGMIALNHWLVGNRVPYTKS